MQVVGQNSGRRRRDRVIGRTCLRPKEVLPDMARSDKPKTSAEIAAEKDAETGLSEVARQHPGTTEDGPLGHRAQRQCAAESGG